MVQYVVQMNEQVVLAIHHWINFAQILFHLLYHPNEDIPSTNCNKLKLINFVAI